MLDRSFISELVYGPLQHGRSRLTASDAAELALRVAARGGVLVHLTGFPETIVTRLRARDGSAPPLERICALIDAYRSVFAALAGTAPIITADTTHVITGHREALVGQRDKRIASRPRSCSSREHR